MTRDPAQEHRAIVPEKLLLPEKAAQGLRSPLADLQATLLLYKSFFVGAWFETLAAQQSDGRVRDTLHRISERAIEESHSLIDVLQQWEHLRPDGERLEPLREAARARLLQDLLALKETATEVVLLAAMGAPTAKLREMLVKGADLDRENADMLRALQGLPDVKAQRRSARPEGEALGAHGSREPGETASGRVQRALDALRAAGDAPQRLVLSPTMLRHLRDEGAVQAAEGTALGLPVTVDFAWRGDCFAVLTGESVSLAELYTQSHRRDDALL